VPAAGNQHVGSLSGLAGRKQWCVAAAAPALTPARVGVPSYWWRTERDTSPSISVRAGISFASRRSSAGSSTAGRRARFSDRGQERCSSVCAFGQRVQRKIGTDRHGHSGWHSCPAASGLFERRAQTLRSDRLRRHPRINVVVLVNTAGPRAIKAEQPSSHASACLGAVRMTERMFAKSRSKPTSVSGAHSKRQRSRSSCTSASSPDAPNKLGRGKARRGPRPIGVRHALDDRAVERDQADAHRDHGSREVPSTLTRQRAERPIGETGHCRQWTSAVRGIGARRNVLPGPFP